MVTIPCQTNEPRYTLDLTLSDAPYRLEFEFNERDARWYMSMRTALDTPIAQGVLVCLDTPLLYRNLQPGRPPGELFAVDTSGAGEEPAFGDLGDRVQLVYITAEDIA